MARRKAQNPYGSCLAARGRLPARHSAHAAKCSACYLRALLSSGPSRSECADRSVSQLLAGTPSGPGGSSDCRPSAFVATRPAGAAPPSRASQTPSRAAPLRLDEGGSISEVRETGIMREQLTQSRHPGESQDRGETDHRVARVAFGVTPYAPSASIQASYAVLGACIPIAERFPGSWEAFDPFFSASLLG